MMPALLVVAPGLMTTVQDFGRPGFQHLGIPVSGALDPISLTAANLLVGNAPGTAVLEIAYSGPSLEVEADSIRIAFAGASAPIEIFAPGQNTPVARLPNLQSRLLRRGDVVRVGALSRSAMLYLAVEGGFDIDPVLGSRSTLTRGGIGGFEGRALRPGDRLRLNQTAAASREEWALPGLALAPPQRFRVIFGPQDDSFTAAALRTLCDATYSVTPACDRMGMRLEGPRLEHAKGYNIVSDGTAPGSIQVPGDGMPIVLLADRQTTGGYPKIATVISADLPAVGRLVPGAKVAFQAIEIAHAEAARRAQAAEVDAMARQITPLRDAPVVDEAKLRGENLVSGMVDARADS